MYTRFKKEAPSLGILFSFLLLFYKYFGFCLISISEINKEGFVKVTEGMGIKVCDIELENRKSEIEKRKAKSEKSEIAS